jgi:hypothetical protein
MSEIQNVPVDVMQEMLLDEVRQIRNRLIGDADKLVNTAEDKGIDATPSRQYRQALRDIPQTFNDAQDVVWPTKPSLPQASA